MFFLVIIITREQAREAITPYVDKHFKNYKYDIINYKSIEGKKNDYVKDNYEISKRFPQALYFKNSKLLIKETIYTLDRQYERLLDGIKKIG